VAQKGCYASHNGLDRVNGGGEMETLISIFKGKNDWVGPIAFFEDVKVM
jgi:hypothetical protein